MNPQGRLYNFRQKSVFENWKMSETDTHISMVCTNSCSESEVLRESDLSLQPNL